MSLTLTYGALLIAIILEVAGTSALQSSQQFTKLIPTLAMGICYAASFYFLSLTLKTIPVGISYAIWSGLGILFISIVGYFVHKQVLDLPAIIGLGFIIAGVIIVNVFSKTVGH